jgi:8-oxo-dGTP diphosphatase
MAKGLNKKNILEDCNTKYKRPNTTVDTLIFTIIETELYVLLIKRENPPFKDVWSLVGGFVDVDTDESLEATATRKLFEKTGVKTPYLEQYKTTGNKFRDPRGWTVSAAYFALIPNKDVVLKTGVGATEIKWSKVMGNSSNDKLAFDHNEILSGCIERLRSKVMYTSLPVYLLPEEFTLSELQQVYEVILGKKIDRKSFYRRILNSGIIEETVEKKFSGRRPAQIYRLVEKDSAYYFSRMMG